MKIIKTIKGLERACESVHSVVTEDTEFTAKAVLFIAYQTERIAEALNAVKLVDRSKYKKIFWRFYFKK